MKAIGTVAFGLASVVGICIAGASIASYVVAEPDHVSLRKDFRPDLWTVEPRRVDRSREHFERLPPVLSSYALAELQGAPSPETAASSTEQAPVRVAITLQDDSLSQHRQWCGSKYKSYDAGTDTYRSFSRARRACVSPGTKTLASGY